MTPFKEWLLFALGGIVAYQNSLVGIGVLFVWLFMLDFATGFVASLSRGEHIESRKLRWSFVKTFCYVGSFLMTLFVGICLNKLDMFIELLKVQVYAAAYIESVSILENLKVLFPSNGYLRWLHFTLSATWVKKIAGLSKIMKEDDKPKNNK